MQLPIISNQALPLKDDLVLPTQYKGVYGDAGSLYKIGERSSLLNFQ
jgi:hypothetical protein